MISVPEIQGEKGEPGATSSVNEVAPDAAGNISLSSDDVPYGQTGQSVTEAVQNAVYTHPAFHPASMIKGLSAVAASGRYNDLTERPDLSA